MALAGIFRGVDLQVFTNNFNHHTGEISVEQLIVRRGQSFTLTLKLTYPFEPTLHPLNITIVTGSHPSEERGTKSLCSYPDTTKRSRSAKAVWTMQLKWTSCQGTNVTLSFTPPADAPVGMYKMTVSYREAETTLAEPMVLFNPWCRDDWVFLDNELQRREYVMNEEGVIFKGSANYIFPEMWDFGQFDDKMVDICMKILDLNHKHKKDPADDVSARCNPIYVGRVVSAMINSEDDRGVLEGRWGGPYDGGERPTHWDGSHAILKKWLENDYHPVKYGQCWVFAAVMCSVMRLLGIPCRVVTNFASAHDVDRNLTIDVYRTKEGTEKFGADSVWNFHVWVEGWMRRPDLGQGNKFDGWQVLDPTPQETSDRVYCCGPAPVKAILDGETHLKYDIPFVFAEVNADCVDWLIKEDGSKETICTDTNRVGQKISTKAVGSNERQDITDTYKHEEGTKKERRVFKYATTRDYSKLDKYGEWLEMDPDREGTDGGVESSESESEDESTGHTDVGTPNNIPYPSLPLSLRFKEVSKPVNGKDVSLQLVLHSKSNVARTLSVHISVQAMTYNCAPAACIQIEDKEETLQPDKDLYIPILVPFSTYKNPMLDSDSMKITAVVKDKKNPDKPYLAEQDVVLLDPPVHLKVFSWTKRYCRASAELIFMNPINETLKNCHLTLTGSGIWREEIPLKLPDLLPSHRVRIDFFFWPYKSGQRTIAADFDCSVFRDIKGTCTFHVMP